MVKHKCEFKESNFEEEDKILLELEGIKSKKDEYAINEIICLEATEFHWDRNEWFESEIKLQKERVMALDSFINVMRNVCDFKQSDSVL